MMIELRHLHLACSIVTLLACFSAYASSPGIPLLPAADERHNSASEGRTQRHSNSDSSFHDTSGAAAPQKGKNGPIGPFLLRFRRPGSPFQARKSVHQGEYTTTGAPTDRRHTKGGPSRSRLQHATGANSRNYHPGPLAVGTDNPDGSMLHVGGRLRVDGDIVRSGEGSGYLVCTRGTGTITGLYWDDTQRALSLRTGTRPGLVIEADGQVGIGTDDPGPDALAVNGTVRCKELVVTLHGWADDVFDPSYQRMPLDSLSHFVRRERRLPGIPSAESVEQNGVEIGENQRMLLRKVEELTLYLIELRADNKLLRERLDALETRVHQTNPDKR